MKRLCSVNTAFASAQKGAGTYYSEWQHIGSLHELLVLVDVTAVSGTTHTLNVTLQTSPKASKDFDHTSLTEMTDAGKQTQPVTNFGKFVRLQAVVAGTDTPTVTFEAFIVAKS